jgi:hypothetical protein
MDTQTCTECKTLKPLTDFYYSKNNALGYATICLECVGNSVQHIRVPATVALPNPEPTKPEPVEEKKEPTPHVLRGRKAKPTREPKPRGFGHVYLMVSENGLYKIGISKNIESRLSDLNRQIPMSVGCIHYFASKNYRKAECFLHTKFSKERVQYEWFRLSPKQVKWILSLRDFGIDNLLTEGSI